jgi:hypothetical protein
MIDRLAELERHGRAYGDLGLSIAWTVGLVGDDAKIARHWQKSPTRLANGDHGAGLFRRGLTHNPCVSLRASGLVGIDIDGESGRDLAQRLVGRFPPTVAVVTGRGHHLWFRAQTGNRHAKIELGHKVTLVDDGYLVMPPALHHSGSVYRFPTGRAPWDIEIAVLPGEIYRALANAADKPAAPSPGNVDDSSPVPQGERHRHLMRLACAMRRVGAGEQTILAALRAENARRCVPPQPDQLVEALAADIARRYQPAERAA